ncbi:MAG: PGF-CTERM sorting domain-containing protein [Candidatus Methanoperedens sp.]
MNNKRLAELLLVSIVILIAPTTFAKPEYLTNLTAIYGASSCNTCHLNGASDGPRTGYGTLFENQVDHVTNASAALIAIGAPPTATITSTATTTMAATPGVTTGTVTPEVTEETVIPEVTEETEIPEVGGTEIPEETTETVEETTVAATTTPRSPGFGIVVSIVGLFAWAILERRKNK